MATNIKFNATPARSDTYAEIQNTVEQRDIFQSARKILSVAIAAGQLDAEYCDVDRRHRGSALNYDLYDAVIVRGSVRTVLFQQRETTCTKYGNSPVKEYLLINILRGKTVIRYLDDSMKRKVIKLARIAKKLGEIIDVVSRRTETEAKKTEGNEHPSNFGMTSIGHQVCQAGISL